MNERKISKLGLLVFIMSINAGVLLPASIFKFLTMTAAIVGAVLFFTFN